MVLTASKEQKVCHLDEPKVPVTNDITIRGEPDRHSDFTDSGRSSSPGQSSGNCWQPLIMREQLPHIERDKARYGPTNGGIV